MARRTRVDNRTGTNWLVVGVVGLSAIAAGLSGIYFLYFPLGGNRGGQSALAGVGTLIGRETWHDVHTWGGVLMVVAIAVHFVLHWQWVVTMSRRVWLAMRTSEVRLSRGSRVNLAINIAVALGFLVTAVSGLYFFFAPEGGYQGGRNPAWDPGILFSRTTWDVIHTWAGAVLLSAAAAHLWIHWRWVVNVTKRVVRSITPGPRSQLAEASVGAQHPSGSTQPPKESD